MTVTVSYRHGTAVLALSGEIDLQTSPELRAALLQALQGGGPLVVDMAAIRYIDSSGVACLVEALQLSRRQGTALVLAAVSGPALRVLRLARLDRIFTLADSCQDALELLQPSGREASGRDRPAGGVRSWEDEQ